MATKLSNTTATARLKQDYLRLMKDPVPYVAASPLPSNILEWHYVVSGPEGTPYEGGLYHGKLIFPKQFPFKPPSIYMITPNGRFKTNTRLCLSISDFHPDTWNPAWTVASILTGLISFMVETSPTQGSIETTSQAKRAFAQQSLHFNLNDSLFCSLFPETSNYIKEQLDELEKSKQSFRDCDLLKSASQENAMAGSPTQTAPSAAAALGVNAAAGATADGDAWGINGQVVNVCVFLGVAAFALTVKCVLNLTR